MDVDLHLAVWLRRCGSDGQGLFAAGGKESGKHQVEFNETRIAQQGMATDFAVGVAAPVEVQATHFPVVENMVQ